MEKLNNRLFFTLGVALLLFAIPNDVSAATDSLSANPQSEVVYDLEKDIYVSENVYNSDGELQGEITVEQVFEDQISLFSEDYSDYAPIKYRGYTRITYTDLVTRTMSFDISMSPNPDRITSAINPNWNWAWGTVNEHTLTHDNRNARLKMFLDGVLFGSTTHTLEARLQNGRILVRKY